MKFTDIFIHRPVLACVVSLVIILLGVRAAFELTVRQYPELSNNQVKITVPYPGADPEVIANFITTPIERVIGSVGGVDFVSSLTGQGITTITLNLALDKDPNEALVEVSSAVNKLRNQLPNGSEDPVIEVARGGGTSAMYLAFYSEVLNEGEITDYLLREVEPRLASIDGVEQVRIIGAQTYAMRVWMKPKQLVAYDLTPSEVRKALENQNVLSTVGETRGSHVKIGLSAATDLQSVEAFRELVVKADGSQLVRLADVADVELGSETYDQSAGWDGKPAIFIGIDARPEANVLDVIGEILEVFPDIKAALPEGLDADIGYDSTAYIRTAISEVRVTLLEAVAIVIAVIFMFLGSARSALIPAVTVPVSLIGALFLMFLMGFTINLLTLLAMVLAIGMVVDDAIIVLENIHRHIESGLKPIDAAVKGARELVGPVIAMTITLVAVYAPIGFQGGITGALFIEFAFTLAGAVLISGVVALTLTPMMCARILKPHDEADGMGRFAAWIDRKFEGWRAGYQRRLHNALDTHHVIGVFAVIAFASMFGLGWVLPNELAPDEDKGFAIAINETDSFTSQDWLDRLSSEVHKVVLASPDIEHMFAFSAPSDGSTNRSFLGMISQPWDQREKSTAEIVGGLGPELSKIAGIRAIVIQPRPLPTPGQGYPVEFVLKASVPPQTLADVGYEIIGRAMASGKFLFMTPRLRMDKPETEVVIDRDKAALLGVSMKRIADDLAAALSGGLVNRFAFADRSYRVVAQIERLARLNPEQLSQIYTRTDGGELLPLSTFVTLRESVVARTIEHAQQLNANTLVGVPKPGVTIGEALTTLENITAEVAPANFQIDYSGPSRQFKQEGNTMLVTFGFAMLIIFLVLAAQFESFRDPFIMLITVPMSICGALLFLNIFGITNGMQLTDFPGMTLNIYTQVGLVTLIGVIAKHGILMVEFANQLQRDGLSKRAAIESASAIRMRPILMTTAALVVAMIPLLISDGPGAASRFSMGMIIASGMTIGTLFTLYVVPAVYLYLARDQGGSQTALP